MSKARTASLLHDLVAYAERVREVYARCGGATGLPSARDAQESVLWNFVVLGEVCSRLGEPFREDHPEIPWRAVIDHRNVVAHGYDTVNWAMIADVIENHLPKLIEESKRLLARFGPPPS